MKTTVFLIRSFLLFSVCVLLTGVTVARSQDQNSLLLDSKLLEGKNLVETATVKGDVSSCTKGLSVFESVLAKEPANKLALYYRSYAEFRLLMLSDDAASKALMPKAIEHVELLLKRHPQWSDAMTLVAGITMLRIDGINAISLSPKCTKLHDASMAADANNPRALIVRGLYTMNAPAFFGGGADKALANFAQAIALCEKNGINAAPTPTTLGSKPQITWGYLDAMIWAGRCHVKMKQYAQGIAYFKKVLALAPDYTWVQQLLPKAEQKLAESGNDTK
jgi:tetratricopeptide (TPR) repeat protein